MREDTKVGLSLHIIIAMGRTALILTDVQNDFLPPNGALAVPDAREILPILEGLLDKSNWDWNVIIAAQVRQPALTI